MISAPVSRTASGFIAFTVAAVPTGMKAGVRISPRRMAISPVRALPSRASMVNLKRGGRSEAIEQRKSRKSVGRNRAFRGIAVMVKRERQARRELLADFRFEACSQEHGSVGRIEDHGCLSAGLGNHVGALRQ